MSGFRVQGSRYSIEPRAAARAALALRHPSGRSGSLLQNLTRRPPIGALAMILAVAPALRAADAPLSDTDILSEANARIEKYRKADALLKIVGADGKPLPPGTTVRIEQTRHAFLFGSNIFSLGQYKDQRLNEAYAKHFAELFNFATLPFYWASYEREQGKPDYARTERLIQWCRENNVTCKGHPLAWNWSDPKWLPDDPAEVARLQFERISTCIQRFKGDIDIWDVVNEATHYDRAELLRQSPKLTAAISAMGVSEFVRKAFRTARQAHPDAVLIINDYRTDQDYIEKVISTLVDEEGKPLYDVIGIQCHQHGGAWSARHTWEICERFARFGKPLHFTEATILSGQLGWGLKDKNPNQPWETTPEGEERQAEEVGRFYTVLFSHPAVEAITWWDFSDAGAWQGAPCGFLRKDMTPKPAYHALKALIKGKWWTTTEAATGEAGEIRFRGFLGEYQVTATGGESPIAGTFRLVKAGGIPAAAGNAPSIIEVSLK